MEDVENKVVASETPVNETALSEETESETVASEIPENETVAEEASENEAAVKADPDGNARKRILNFDLYRVFYEVARTGSLTRAAEELYCSQPAISQSIKQLETQLGTPLFTRVRRGMQLTKQGGAVIYKDVERAIKLLKGAEKKLKDRREGATGTLRIGASASIFQYVLSSKIVEYRNRYPQVNIQLISDVSTKIIEALKEDRCDVGFLNMPTGDEDDDLQLNNHVMILHDIFVAGKAFEHLKDAELNIWDLQAYPLVLMREDTVARRSFDSFCRSLGIRFEPAVNIDSWDFMKQLTTHGMGIGCIPREYVLTRLSQGLLFELNVQPELPSRSIGMAVVKEKDLPYAARAFMELFEDDPLPKAP